MLLYGHLEYCEKNRNTCIYSLPLQLTSHFFGLSIEIHTTVDVYNELYIEQQELLKAYKLCGKLTIHNQTAKEKEAIRKIRYPLELSEEDKSVLYLADVLDATLLSSDKAVRRYAKGQKIEYHGMLWIFDKLIEETRLEKKEAKEKLKQLVQQNITFRNNLELVKEIEKRITQW